MLIPNRLVVFPMFVCCLFPKYSLSEKPEDCIKGKQYWSTHILPSGTCASCPPNWENCKQQSTDDQAPCFLSCRVVDTAKPEPKPNLTTVKPSPPRPTPFKAPKVTNSTNASLPVVYRSAKPPPEIKEDEGQKPPVAEENLGKVVLIVVGCICGLMFVIVVLIGAILYRKIRKKNVQLPGEGGEVDGEKLPLQPEGQPIPEEQKPHNVQSSIKQLPILQASSSTNINVPQDTEELDFSSNLNLDSMES